MIFQHTIDKVLDGTQTQTRRLVKSGQVLYEDFYDIPIMEVRDARLRTVYGTDHPFAPKTYGVQPGHGKPAVCRIRIFSIRREDVREISDADVRAEGFESRVHFLVTWAETHDLPASRFRYDGGLWRELNFFSNSWHDLPWRLADNAVLDEFSKRPAERYDAWVLAFEVVNDAR